MIIQFTSLRDEMARIRQEIISSDVVNNATKWPDGVVNANKVKANIIFENAIFYRAWLYF